LTVAQKEEAADIVHGVAKMLAASDPEGGRKVPEEMARLKIIASTADISRQVLRLADAVAAPFK
jgi:hypothetical protein